jgi:hypothetical protein
MRQVPPWVRVDKEYRFHTDEGPVTLAGLFRARSQLLVYHFMFCPDYQAGCPACSAIADGFNGFVAHLHPAYDERVRPAQLLHGQRSVFFIEVGRFVGRSDDGVERDECRFDQSAHCGSLSPEVDVASLAGETGRRSVESAGGPVLLAPRQVFNFVREVLMHPLGPMMATVSPRATSRSTSLTAYTSPSPLPKCLRSPQARTMAAPELFVLTGPADVVQTRSNVNERDSEAGRNGLDVMPQLSIVSPWRQPHRELL